MEALVFCCFFFLLISQWNQNMVANTCNSFLLLLWDRKPVFAAPTLASSQMVCGDQMQASKTWWHTCLDTIFHYFKGREWRGQAVRACVKCAFQAAATIADCSGPLGLGPKGLQPTLTISIHAWGQLFYHRMKNPHTDTFRCLQFTGSRWIHKLRRLIETGAR